MADKQQKTEEQILADIFGVDENNPWNASAPEQDTVNPEQEAPEIPVVPEKHEENDDKRYQYHQARADKMAQELAEARAKLDLLTKQEKPVEKEEEFPPPPNEPEAPYGFSEEEARTVPNSESAKYVRNYAKWQSDMLKYNTLFTQYTKIKQQEELDALRSKIAQEEENRRVYAEQTQQLNAIKSSVMEKYKFTPEQADDFIIVMSDPNNYGLDDQVKYYMMKKGITVGAPAPDSFKQASAAGMFPQPLVGINVPSAQPDLGKKEDDLLFDALKNLEANSDWTSPRK